MNSDKMMVKIKQSLVTLALLAAVCGLGGCAAQRAKNEAQYNAREKSLVLIDEGKKLEREGSTDLALDRYNRSAALNPSADAFFRMGRIFEARNENEKAGAAYQESLRLAPDLHEARMALIALGYMPPDGQPKPDEVNRAKVWAVKARPALPVSRSGQAAVPAAPAADAKSTTGAQTAADALPLPPPPLSDPDTTPTQPVAAAPASAPSADAADASDETETPAPKTADDLQAERQKVLTNAAENRLPTAGEVRDALFGAKADQGKLPSATQPTYTNDQDIILGTYAYHFNKAEQLRKRLQFDKAADEYENATKADPTQMEARLDLGDMLMKLERYQRARLYYEQASTDFPNAPEPLLKLGNYHIARQQPDRARQYYQQALRKNPKFVDAINNLAALDMQDKDYKEAAEFLDRILELDPKYQNAWLNRGIIASEVEKNPELARTCFQHYVELGGPRKDEVRKWINELPAKPAK